MLPCFYRIAVKMENIWSDFIKLNINIVSFIEK